MKLSQLVWAVCTIQISDADFERLNLSHDLRVPYWHPYEAADAIGPHSSLPIALNHTGFPWARSKSGIISWKKTLATIAACPNVFGKLSELGLKMPSGQLTVTVASFWIQ
jgi:predicted TIM-barrel fold metal-dependent hydrolase